MNDKTFFTLLCRVLLGKNATKKDRLLLAEEIVKNDTRLTQYAEASYTLKSLLKTGKIKLDNLE